MLEVVILGNFCLYVDDILVYCIGFKVDKVCNLLNNVLNKFNKCCMIVF